MATTVLGEENGLPCQPIRQDAADAMFAAEFSRHSASSTLRREHSNDRTFLGELFMACSPLAESLPAALLQQQADLNYHHHANVEFPCSRWILVRGARAIGRIALNWDYEGECLGVDIAILPSEQGNGIGLALLQAWLATADHFGRACVLRVAYDNRRAQAIYTQLGFVAVGNVDQPSVTMTRPPSGQESG